MRIKQLPEHIANQIAAGEVIERPASVVKELLENALDAKATQINIELRFGGLNQIKVSDNGMGIMADDLPLAISAHATSKISELEDLFNIKSMGFRGEALASIASVSRFSISSKAKTENHGVMLEVEGDKVDILPCARAQGTTVEVCDLFYNTPVRRRFLKSERSEFLVIDAVIKRFALSEPRIAINVKHNDKEYLSLPPALCENTRVLRIKKLFGKNFIDNAIYLDVRCGDMRLYGWVSGVEYQRSQNDKLFVYLNQRMIKDKLIFHALRQAYEDKLHPGRFPACLLYLTVPTQEVDINVHPTKHEVRFQQPRLVHDFLVSEISKLVAPQMPALADVTSPVKTYEVRESFVKEPMPASHFVSHDWLVLNKHFVLLKLKDKHHLVSLNHANFLLNKKRLKSEEMPLPSRELLVAISVSVDEKSSKKFTVMEKNIKNLGINFKLTENLIVVESIPIMFPQLDVKLFLQKFMENNKDILEILLSSLMLDAYQIDNAERQQIISFVEENMDNEQILLPLNIEKCREIIGA